MQTNENGFSLIELVVALAISSTLAAVGLATLAPLVQAFEEKAASIEQTQQQQADELQAYLDNIAN